MKVLLFLVLFTLIFSCKKKEEQLTIAVGGTPEEIRYWSQIIEEFEKKEGIEVKILRQPADTDLRRHGLAVSLSAKEKDPDVFLMDIAWVGFFIKSGWLEKLRDIDSSPFIEKVLFVDKKGEDLYALPLFVDCGLLYYRKDLLEKYNCSVPSTWEQLLECSLKVQRQERKRDPKFYAFVWQGAQYEGLTCVFLEFSTSAGGSLDDLDSAANLKALSFMRDLIRVYAISPPNTYTEMKEEEVRRFFQAGKALFERNWSYAWILHNMENSPVKGKVGIAPLPAFKGGKRASCLGGWHVGISAFSDKKEEALKLLKFLVSYETQKKLALNLGWNPSRRDVYEDKELLKKFPQIKKIKEACEYAIPRPSVSYYIQMSEVIRPYINAVLAGRLNPLEALTKAQRELNLLERTYR